MADSLKEKILKLRIKGNSYEKISVKLGCSKATISYHCLRNNLGGNGKREVLTKQEIDDLNLYYKTHTVNDCVSKFNLSKTTVVKYTDNKHVLLSKEELNQRNYKRVKSHRQKIKDKAIEYKGGECEKCGYNKCKWAFDFHHTDPSKKDFSIARYSTLSWEKIKKELNKCIMVCANCHRELHYNEYINNTGMYAADPDKIENL